MKYLLKSLLVVSLLIVGFLAVRVSADEGTMGAAYDNFQIMTENWQSSTTPDNASADLNRDGTIDFLDFQKGLDENSIQSAQGVFQNNWQQSTTSTGKDKLDGDLNSDGVVDFLDFQKYLDSQATRPVNTNTDNGNQNKGENSSSQSVPAPLVRSHGGSYVTGFVLGTTTEDTSSSTSQVLGASTFQFTQFLRRGMFSDDVRELQDRLRAEGFFKLTTSTGYFGPITFQAVKDYQAAHGLPVTGFVGPLTIAELNK